MVYELSDTSKAAVLFDDWHLMGNAINVKIDWDIDNPDSIEGKKIWKDDKEENRPETLIIHVKDGDKEIEGSPVTLEKSDFEGEDTWTWSIDLKKESDDEDGGEDGDDVDKEESKIDIDNLVVTEEYPEDYEYKDKYTSRTDDLDITNTWHDEEPDTIDIQGKKIWKDDNDKDKLRPDKIIVRLLADGKEIKSVETSKAGGWKYEFDKLPKYKENNGEEDGEQFSQHGELGADAFFASVEGSAQNVAVGLFVAEVNGEQALGVLSGHSQKGGEPHPKERSRSANSNGSRDADNVSCSDCGAKGGAQGLKA